MAGSQQQALQQYRQQQLTQAQSDSNHILRTPIGNITRVSFPTFQQLLPTASAFSVASDVEESMVGGQLQAVGKSILLIRTSDGRTYMTEAVFNPLTNQILPPQQMVSQPGTPSAPAKQKRTLNSYQEFMRAEIARLKTVYPNIAHQDAFRAAAANWKAIKNGRARLY